MNKTVQRILEFDRIRELLAEQAGSSLAKEKAKNLQPSDDFDEVGKRLTDTREAVTVLAAVNPPLGGIFDIRPAIKRAKMGMTLETEELSSIQNTLYAIKELKYFFRDLDKGIEADNLRETAMTIEVLGQLARHLLDTIDEHGGLRDDASNELLKIRRGIRVNERRIKDSLQSILHNAEYQKAFQENIISMRGDRYVLPIKQEYRRVFPGIVHDQSATGATLFIEPMTIVERNNEIKELMLAERREIERILSKLTAEVAQNAATLELNLEIISRIDFAFAKAKLAKVMRASEPEINESGRTELRMVRHPLIDDSKVVPIDISLGENYRLLLVTGPNTGGKTVCMKTLGIVAMMAQSGLFIPAEIGSTLSLYHDIYADIGDEQSIEQSLSTFSAHMKHIVAILQRVGPLDLVLLDELGAGTDPEEGASLAKAILEHLLSLGVSAVATTHYSELKTFAYSTSGVENACVEFDEKTLRPTYRLLIGLPGSSNAFAISRRLGMTASIVDRASALLKNEHADFARVINQLEEKRRYYEELSAGLRHRENRLKAKEAAAEKLSRELKNKKDDILRKAREESAAILRQARVESTEIIKELKAQFNDSGVKKRQQVINEARTRLQAATSSVRNIEPDQFYDVPVDIKRLAVGDVVYVPSLAQKATVVKINGKELTVEMGQMRTTVKADNCRFVSAGKPEKEISGQTKQAGIFLSKVKQASRQIDIRGMLVDEGIDAVSSFLDDAALAGLKEVIIIHGKGTGQLRQGIQDYLSKHRLVGSFALADIDEGGSGATSVRLK